MSDNPIPLFLLCLSVISGITIRILKSRRSGLDALKMELLYLFNYAFLCGLLISMFLQKAVDLWIFILVITAFFTGFIIRVFPLFRQLSEIVKPPVD